MITMSLKYISGIAIRVKREAEIKVSEPVKSKKCSVLLIKDGIKTSHWITKIRNTTKPKSGMFDIETLPWLAAKAISVESNMTMKDAGMVVLFGIDKF